MPENFNEIPSLNTEEDDAKKLDTFLEEQERKARERIPGEIDKTPLEEEFIRSVETSLQKEIEACNADSRFTYTAEKVHFLPDEIFDSLSGDYSGGTIQGRWDVANGERILMRYPREKNYDSSFYKNIIHEMVHAAGYASFAIGKNELGEPENFYGEKVGFSFYSANKASPFFIGLNEIMVEKIAHDVFFHLPDLEAYMVGKKYALDEWISAIGIIERVLEGLSARMNLEKDVLWREMERAYFEGKIKMEYLRAIEDLFGKNSLRVLDRIQPYEGKEGGINKKIHDYFAADDATVRDALREEILSAPENEKNP
jgi:hypothetical protein